MCQVWPSEWNAHLHTHTNMQCVCSRKPYVAKCGNLFAMQRLDWEPYILDMCARLAFTIAAATINIEASHCRTLENTLSCEQRGLECARLEKKLQHFHFLHREPQHIARSS